MSRISVRVVCTSKQSFGVEFSHGGAVTERVDEGLHRAYDIPENVMGWDGGWVGGVADTEDLLLASVIHEAT